MSGRGRTWETEREVHSRRKREQEEWAQHGGYMNAKIQKLISKYDADKDHEEIIDESQPKIFKNVAIFVNGYTEPSFDILRRHMIDHGGQFEHYYTATRVTHIIATSLALSKQKLFHNKKVVLPSWITDSIEKGRLQPYEKYLLLEGNRMTRYLSHKTGTEQAHKERSCNEPDREQPLTSSATPSASTPSTSSVTPSASTPSTSSATPSASTPSTSSVTPSASTPSTSSATPSASTPSTSSVTPSASTPSTSSATRSASTPSTSSATPSASTPSTSSATPSASTPSTSSATPFASTSSTSSAHPSTSNAIERDTSSSKSSHMVSPPSMLDADQPGFVSEFYGNSRLHHLSHWRTHLKDVVNEIRADPLHKLTGRERLIEKYSDKVGDVIHPPHKIYMHIDMDCFFVSVVLRNHPELRDKPVVVAHSKGGSVRTASSFGSMSQIASCNYPARKAGITNGMMMGKALSLCPQLKALPYDFEGYSQVSTILYETVASYTTEIEAVSCDEMYVEITSLMDILSQDEFARELRGEIYSKTGCPCSAGMGGNLLLARLATRRAKPNGQFYIGEEEVDEFMSKQSARDLPGVGRAAARVLERLNSVTCADLQLHSLDRLKKEFGVKTGEGLYNLCRGRDERQLKADQPRQSVSCDINYGVRLRELSQVEDLFKNISVEVAKKLDNAKLCGKQITLKLKVRSPDAPVQSAKFMGHGICDNLTKSSGLRAPTKDAILIQTVCWNIWKGWSIVPTDLRGVGIQVTKLQPLDSLRTSAQPDLSNFISKGKGKSSLSDGTVKVNSACVPKKKPVIPSLCHLVELADVQSLLRRWISSIPGGPCRKDGERFQRYLVDLVNSHHLDMAHSLFLHLHLMVKRSSAPAWLDFIKTIRTELQGVVLAEYHAHIDLPD